MFTVILIHILSCFCVSKDFNVFCTIRLIDSSRFSELIWLLLSFLSGDGCTRAKLNMWFLGVFLWDVLSTYDSNSTTKDIARPKLFWCENWKYCLNNSWKLQSHMNCSTMRFSCIFEGNVEKARLASRLSDSHIRLLFHCVSVFYCVSRYAVLQFGGEKCWVSAHFNS